MPILIPEIDVTTVIRTEVDNLLTMYKEGTVQRESLNNIIKELDKIKEANHDDWVLRNSTFVR